MVETWEQGSTVKSLFTKVGDGFVEVVDDVKKTVEKVHVHGFIEEPPPDPDIESEQ